MGTTSSKPSRSGWPSSQPPVQLDTGRRNNSSTASYNVRDLEKPFAQGAFRYVAKGIYTDGERKGQTTVCKWFKTGIVFENSFFEYDIKAVYKALAIVESFNAARIIEKTVRINLPEVWRFNDDATGGRAGSKVLSEPYIENYQKFNSSTGWNNADSLLASTMQALSHFSYHHTGGQYVLCDLQGGIYNNCIILTDPVILSKTREFGVTDLGMKGISTFFSQHKCSSLCKWNWDIPKERKQHFSPVNGTTMVPLHVPTRSSRPPSTTAFQ